MEAIFAGWLLIEIVLRSWLVGCFDYLYGEAPCCSKIQGALGFVSVLRGVVPSWRQERLWNSFDICVAIVAGLDVFVYRIGLNEP